MKRLLLAAASIAAMPGLVMAKTFPFGPTVQCSTPATQSFISKEMTGMFPAGTNGFRRLMAVPQQQSPSACLITWKDSVGAIRVGTFTYEYDPAAELQNLPLRLILNYQDG